MNAFKNGKRIDSFADPKQGLATADNGRFLRLWHEVDSDNIGFGCDKDTAISSASKWFPYNKGGGYKKWYGNNEYLINWLNDGFELRNFKGSVIRSPQFYFSECITWCKVTISNFSMRYIPQGFIFDVAGCSLFVSKEKMNHVLAFANSKVNSLILSIISPTVNYEVGHVASLPILWDISRKEIINTLVTQNISISKTDWDSFETSWDFTTHPFITSKRFMFEREKSDGIDDLFSSCSIKHSFNLWNLFTHRQFGTLKNNEEELNRIFIEIYGLQDELTPEVADKDVTIRKADLVREIKSFISYAVGCMFGRYSLDVDGLAFAGGKFDKNKYKTYIPEDDNIIPITDNDYFDDDIVLRFVEFVRKVYGEQTLDENLDFIANALYPNANGTTTDKIRRYFLNDFYKDHVKIYQKKPIYWQFESGKQGGFKALIYLHRYDKYTVARVRTDYLHPLQRKYEAEIKRLETLSDMKESTPREQAEYKKKAIDLQKKIDECRAYDQVVAHIAHQTIELDLDDGVTVNYAKFQGVEVPQGDGKADVKMDLLGKI